MKYFLLGSLALSTSCIPFIGSRCDTSLDQRRAQRAVDSIELFPLTMSVQVSYDKQKHNAVVTGYDINQRFTRSMKVPQSCTLNQR
jgi:hypothetical protein